MRYVSMFATILLIWIAVILMALATKNATEIFQLYVAVMTSTILLFLIGFARK